AAGSWIRDRHSIAGSTSAGRVAGPPGTAPRALRGDRAGGRRDARRHAGRGRGVDPRRGVRRRRVDVLHLKLPGASLTVELDEERERALACVGRVGETPSCRAGVGLVRWVEDAERAEERRVPVLERPAVSWGHTREKTHERI